MEERTEARSNGPTVFSRQTNTYWDAVFLVIHLLFREVSASRPGFAEALPLLQKTCGDPTSREERLESLRALENMGMGTRHQPGAGVCEPRQRKTATYATVLTGDSRRGSAGPPAERGETIGANSGGSPGSNDTLEIRGASPPTLPHKRNREPGRSRRRRSQRQKEEGQVRLLPRFPGGRV